MHPIWSNIFRTKEENKKDVTALLTQVPIFQGLSKNQLREFAKIAHVRQYRAGETVFWKGEPGVGMYIVQKGKVAVFVGEDPTHPDYVLATLQDGDFFGELALLDDSPRSASVAAIEPTELIGIFRPDLFSLFERRPALGVLVLRQLAQMVGERLKHTNVALDECRKKIESSRQKPEKTQ
jgi:CRP-like cAMP-binding protein